MVKTITLERIFINKLFAAEAYVRNAQVKNRAFDAAKHIYDLAIMSKLSTIIEFITNETVLENILNIRIKEEINRLDGMPGIAPKEFIFFSNIKTNTF